MCNIKVAASVKHTPVSIPETSVWAFTGRSSLGKRQAVKIFRLGFRRRDSQPERVCKTGGTMRRCPVSSGWLSSATVLPKKEWRPVADTTAALSP